MKNIRNFKKSLIEIAQILSSSSDVQRLLTVDSPDSLEVENFSLQDFNTLMKNKYISFAPLENAIENIGRNTFLIITLDDSNFTSYASGTIYIGTDENHLMLNKNKFRMLELIDVIAKTLDGTKLSAAGMINLNSFSKTIYSEFTFGYRISFTIRDQDNEGAEL